MARVLILHASHYGQTASIAQRIAQTLRGEGHIPVLVDSAQVLATQVTACDAVVIGSPIRFGRHDAALQRVVHENAGELNRMPNGFFSVSLSASRPGKTMRDAQRCVDEFVSATGFQPRICALFGGALAYTRYPFWLRWLMRFVSGRQGGSVDTTRDHEYTDWSAVEAFARELAGSLASAGTSASGSWSPPGRARSA